MDRAYSILEIRAMNDDQRIIEGIASTPTPDRASDVVDPMGAKYALPMPLLWQHRHDEPIGWVEFAKPNAKGIPFKARIANPDDFESETIKERLRMAWDSIRNKLVRAVSIGFRPLEGGVEILKNGGYKFNAWEWLELSTVTIPMQAEASISTVKSFDQAAMAASADSDVVEPEIPAKPMDKAVTGKTVHVAKLNAPAPDGAKPFVINRIKHLR